MLGGLRLHGTNEMADARQRYQDAAKAEEKSLARLEKAREAFKQTESPPMADGIDIFLPEFASK